MKLSLFPLAFAALIGAASAADAPDNRTPIQRYQGDTQSALFICQMSYTIASMRAELGQAQDEKSDYVGCISGNKATMKASLDQALRTLKSAGAKEALKSYHVAVVVALEGIPPGAGERKISYEQRQQALKGKVTEAWARFEIEQ